MSLATGAAAALISLSVPASVQCCIVMSGTGEPDRTTFISHRPALRTGNSTAAASPASSRASVQQNERSRRVMSRAPFYLVLQAQAARRSEQRAQRLFGGAIGHPATGERDIAAVVRLH